MIGRLVVAVAALALGSFLLWKDMEERAAWRPWANCTQIGMNAIACPALSITQNN
ncbi:MAG: hypothetical protein JWR80_9987 [Bradyrhizobium sp.]|nr:hypothetical protein [Bradyrhizobium sp.]